MLAMFSWPTTQGRNEPGTGEVNYSRVFQELKSLQYDGFVGLECNPRKDAWTAAQRIYRSDLF